MVPRDASFGDDKDRVLIRNNGAPTYLAADSAYLMDKFARGFEHLIYLWGADHHGTVVRLKAAAQALGLRPPTTWRSGCFRSSPCPAGERPSRLPREPGVVVPLDELIDEVGVDAARYTFLTRSIDAPIDFDIELAKRAG